MKNYSNPIRITQLEETLNELKKLGVTDVYIQILDGNNIEFADTKDPAKTYMIAYSNIIHDMAKASS